MTVPSTSITPLPTTIRIAPARPSTAATPRNRTPMPRCRSEFRPTGSVATSGRVPGWTGEKPGAVAAGFISTPRSARMPRQAVRVAGRLWAMIAERGAAVFGAHQPAQLDAHQHHLGIVRARRDPAYVRGKRDQLLPAFAAVSAALESAAPTPDVHRVAIERQAVRPRTLQALRAPTLTNASPVVANGSILHTDGGDARSCVADNAFLDLL